MADLNYETMSVEELAQHLLPIPGMQTVRVRFYHGRPQLQKPDSPDVSPKIYDYLAVHDNEVAVGDIVSVPNARGEIGFARCVEVLPAVLKTCRLPIIGRYRAAYILRTIEAVTGVIASGVEKQQEKEQKELRDKMAQAQAIALGNAATLCDMR